MESDEKKWELLSMRKHWLENHLVALIGQPIREFQQKYKVKLINVNVIVLDVSTKVENIQIIDKIKLTIE